MNSYENDIDPKGIDPELNLSGWEYFWRKSELLYLGEHQQHEGELNVFTVLGLHKWAEFFYAPYYISSLTNLHSVIAKSWSTLSYTKTSSMFVYKLLSCFFILTLAYKKSKKKKRE